MEKLKETKMHVLAKALIVILAYFIYSQLFGTILNVFGINIYDNWLLLLIGDLLFLVFCVYAYNDDIEKDFKDFKNDIKKNILIVLKYIAILYLFIFGIAIISTIVENITNTTINLSNNNAIIELNLLYRIFRTLIFSVIAETIVYHKTVKSIAPEKKWTYLLVAITFYGIMNIIYQPITGMVDLYILLACAIRLIPTCLLYNKTNNIVFIMIMSFIYNAITLLLTLAGGGA